MKGGNIDTSPDPANIEPGELSTNQEATVLPVFAGETKFALVWLCDPFNQFTKDAPQERPGKK